MPSGRASPGCAGSHGLSASPDGSGMFGTAGGALNRPPQAARRSTAKITRFMGALLRSEPGARDQRDRAAWQRVVEEVLEGLVVEEVSGFELDPEGPHRPDAGACVEQELCPDVRGPV